jgi:acyl carrier protein
MTETDIRAVLQEELGNIAPEIDLLKVNPSADLREALDIDSMDFLNFVTAIHRRLGVDIPELDLSEARHTRWGGRLSQDQAWADQELTTRHRE